MKLRKKKGWVLAIAVLLFLNAFMQKVWAQEKIPRVTLAYAAISAAFLPLWVAKEKNLYRRNGVDVDLIYIAGGSKLMQALISGNVDFVSLGSGVIEANVRGGETVFLASWVNNFVFSIYGVPDVRSPSDLKGKKIGVTRFGTSTEYATIEALKRIGLDARKDVTLIQTGGIPETLAAIQAGAIQAGTVSPPNTFRAAKLGLVEVINITKLKIPFITTGLVSTKNYVNGHKEVTKNVIKAVVESIRIIKNDREFTKGVISRYTRLSDDDLLDDTYSVFSREYPEIPYPSRDALKFMVGLIGDVQKQQIRKPIESFIDISLLKSLEQEGFFKSVVQR